MKKNIIAISLACFAMTCGIEDSPVHRDIEFETRKEEKLGPEADSLPDAPSPKARPQNKSHKTNLGGIVNASSTQVASLETLEGLEVSMPGANDQSADGIHFFGVNAKQGGEQWTVMHRYSDFETLKGKLGLEADSLPNSPFPAKFGWFPSEMMLEERREGLEKWSQHVLLHANSTDSWKEPLQEFFHPEALIEQKWVTDQLRRVTTRLQKCTNIVEQDTSLETLDGLEALMPGENDQTDGAVHFFGVNVKQGGEQWIVMHRYSDFETLRGKLGPEADSLPDAPFPGKFSWPFLSESMLQERREGLEKWSQQVLLHASSADSWKEPLQEFFHPEALSVICSKDRILGLVKTTIDKLGEYYEDGHKYCQEEKSCKERNTAAKDRYEKLKLMFNEKMEELGDTFYSRFKFLAALVHLSREFLHLLGLE